MEQRSICPSEVVHMRMCTNIDSDREGTDVNGDACVNNSAVNAEKPKLW
eukprot:CAMPEP_0196810528 /NCGR_PEP_ID=MMETSP1362-20130617/11057_1 /TAXON_ID=163516 /ORGANISM="Leptocylindrus danicus, Strain CCMP1856" /LENGTH=48 /DNA_ID= /DNA_START= /DNA_END= /DNA_ORIENTATION=